MAYTPPGNDAVDFAIQREAATSTAYSPPGNDAVDFATQDPPAPSNLAVDAVTGDQIDLSWTDNASGEAAYRVLRSTDGGSTFVQDGTDLAADTTTYTTTSLLDGEQYTLVVEVAAPGGRTARSGTVTATTALPDAQQPTLNNGIEDELTADYPDVTDNGSYRVQLREEGETAWDATATGFQEQVVDESVAAVTFTGLEDGESYEVRPGRGGHGLSDTSERSHRHADSHLGDDRVGRSGRQRGWLPHLPGRAAAGDVHPTAPDRDACPRLRATHAGPAAGNHLSGDRRGVHRRCNSVGKP